MPLVTFTSDFGNGDHYVAAVKAAILGKEPSVQLIDISHDIKQFDLPHLAFTITSVFRQFPTGTIHLIGLNGNDSVDEYLAVKLEEHIFLLPDNGLIGLLSDESPTEVVIIKSEMNSLFPTRDLLAPIVLALSKGESFESFGTASSDYKRMMSRKVKATRKEIAGQIIHVDQYGNLISNIRKTDFDILSKEKQFKIQIGKETSTRIHLKYQDAEPGDIFFVFNSLGLLEIGINQGNANQLLGLDFDAAINIQFEE
jgi:S-adenosylmethionine hydrolase